MDVPLSIFASDLLPVFLIAGVGFALGRLVGTNVKTLAHIVFYALIPSFVFNLLINSHVASAQVWRLVLMNVSVLAAMGMIGRLLAVPLGLTRPELSAFLLVVMFSNTGNYGLPVVLFAFGQDALAYASVFFVTGSTLTYSVGLFLAAAGRGNLRSALAGIARAPAIYAVAAAAIVLATGMQIPLAMTRPIGLMSDAAMPVMLLVLGMQLERATLPERPVPVVVAVAVSLLVAPLVALGLASVLGVAGPARQASVILASMPVAVVTTILALEFDVAPAFVTSTVFLSTLLSPLTLTPLIAYLR